MQSTPELSELREPKLPSSDWIEVNLRDNWFSVTDNGIGFTKQQFETFLAPNITFKSGQNCRGKKVSALRTWRMALIRCNSVREPPSIPLSRTLKAVAAGLTMKAAHRYDPSPMKVYVVTRLLLRLTVVPLFQSNSLARMFARRTSRGWEPRRQGNGRQSYRSRRRSDMCQSVNLLIQIPFASTST